jgi:hypothetical protein
MYACMFVGLSEASALMVFVPVVNEVGPPAPVTVSSRPLIEAAFVALPLIAASAFDS